MANLTNDVERDLTKHDKLVNAWLAAGRDASVGTVASLTGASQSYASQVRQAMEEGDLSEEDVEEVTDQRLVEEYERRLESGAKTEPTGTGADQASTGPGGQSQGTAGSRAAGAPSQSGAQAQVAVGYGGVPPQQPPRPGEQAQGTGAESAAGSGPAQDSAGGLRAGADAERSVPVGRLRAVDETLSVLEDEARFEVENLPPQQPQRNAALAKLYVTRTARRLLDEAVAEGGSAAQATSESDESAADDEASADGESAERAAAADDG